MLRPRVTEQAALVHQFRTKVRWVTARATPATCANLQRHAGKDRQYLAPLSWWEGSLAMASLKTGVVQEHEHVRSGKRESVLPDQHLEKHEIILVPLVVELGELRDLATIQRLEEGGDPFAVKSDRPQPQSRNGKADKEI